MYTKTSLSISPTTKIKDPQLITTINSFAFLYARPSLPGIDLYHSTMAQALQEEFKEHAEKAKSLPSTTKDADKLVLYGLYKQATVGSANTNRPGFFSPTERAKWDAWKAVEGKSQEEAIAEYIEKVKQLLAAAT